jgi:hypothetical protein
VRFGRGAAAARATFRAAILVGFFGVFVRLRLMVSSVR